MPYAPRALPERSVFRFALSGFDLQAGFNDVAGRGEVGGWHAGNSTRGEELYDAEFLGLAFAEEVTFEVVVGREVNRGERDIAKEAGGSAFVEADETEIFDNPHCGTPGDAFNGFGDFALDLETDFDDLEGVGEHLMEV